MFDVGLQISFGALAPVSTPLSSLFLTHKCTLSLARTHTVGTARRRMLAHLHCQQETRCLALLLRSVDDEMRKECVCLLFMFLRLREEGGDKFASWHARVCICVLTGEKKANQAFQPQKPECFLSFFSTLYDYILSFFLSFFH